MYVLGIDIGGVISDRLNDTKQSENDPDAFLKAPPVVGALETIRVLDQEFGGRVYFVSKCHWKMQLKTRLWLREQYVYELTGIDPDHVWYCLERREKADICKVLGITHFIDDRLEILGTLKSVPNKILFRPNQKEVDRYAEHLPLVKRVESWGEVFRLITTR